MKRLFHTLLSCTLLAGSMTITYSCASDFLDTTPTESTGANEAIATTGNAMQVLNGIAKLMITQHASFTQGFAGENNIIAHYENYPSENWLFNAYASGWSAIHNQEFHTRTNSIYDAYAWYYYYGIVTSANSLLANIDNATGSEDEKAYIKASALTFRSYAFEKLIRYYCYRWEDSNQGASQGLVLRLDESTGSMPYSSLAATYQQIYKDLDEAISLFKSTNVTRSASDVWMPNINVAHAVYARAALSKHDYERALSEAKLAREGFPLMSNEDYTAGFCNPTSEWIFGSYGSAQENVWYWSFGTQFACNGHYGTQMDTGTGTISRELIDKIPDTDIRKSLFLSKDKFPGADFNKAGVLDGTGKIKDKELCKVARQYCDKIAAKGLPAPYQSNAFYLGSQLKFYVFDLPGVGYLPFIRSSEMLLVEAEAYYQLKKESEAQATLITLNTNSKRNPGYTCTKTGDELWQEIMTYRCLELWGEGFEWSDFKRWNRPVVRKSFADGGSAQLSIAVTIPADGVNKWTWDVPLNETDYNDALK